MVAASNGAGSTGDCPPSEVQLSPRRGISIPTGAYVVGGAMVGTVARAVLDVISTSWQLQGLHFSTIAVNLVGAFAMGFLTACWSRKRGQNAAWDRLKLLFGTGMLGAFTTYSSFALAIATSSTPRSTLTVGLVVVIVGIVAVSAGVGSANWWLTRRSGQRSKR